MSTFINYNNGAVSIDTFRFPNALATDMADIMEAFESSRNEILTASLDIWAKEELAKIDITNKSRDEAETIVFSEKDFFDKVLENIFGFDMSDYPELRDIQIDFINDQINE
jgi:hypothetical protein